MSSLKALALEELIETLINRLISYENKPCFQPYFEAKHVTATVGTCFPISVSGSKACKAKRESAFK